MFFRGPSRGPWGSGPGSRKRGARRFARRCVTRMTDLSALFNLPPSPVVTSAHPLRWGAATAAERGPVIASRDPALRNAIGAHAGGYGVYRALAIAAGDLPSNHRPDLTDTAPADLIGPHPQWSGDSK